MATITEKSRTKEIIDRMQGIIDGAPSVPLAQGKISIYKEEMQSLLNELAGQMEIEIKTYHDVNDRKGKIISEAKKEAERIILEAEHSASRMRVNKSTTGVSPLDYNRLNQEELDSLSSANEIYAASLIYTDEMLTEVSEMINTAYQNIRGDYEIVMQVLEEKLSTINSNRSELMTSLQEMDAAERSQQILEIGQLLSNELYMSRMKAKMNSDEYEDGSVQLSLELAEEQEEKARLANEKAERAQAALAQMTAERDALKETVKMMKNEGMAATVRDVQANPTKPEAPASSNDEYEVVYVSEDELEDGEEYEVEYVDDEEYEKIMGNRNAAVNEAAQETSAQAVQVAPTQATQAQVTQAAQVAPVQAAQAAPAPAQEEDDSEDIDIPLIPRFKRTQKVATISSEMVKDIKKADGSLPAQNEKQPEGGFIERAVNQKEKSQLEETVKVDGSEHPTNDASANGKKKSKKSSKKDDDVKTDSDGNEYVQATMVFSEDFEITEF